MAQHAHALEMDGNGNMIAASCRCGHVYRCDDNRTGTFRSNDPFARDKIRALHRAHKAEVKTR